MPAPTSGSDLLELVRKSGVIEDKRLDSYIQKLRAPGPVPAEPGPLAKCMVRDGIITQFQAEQFLQGKWRRFTLGKYKILEKIGAGGMGNVYLCEHRLMRRRTAVKVLPLVRAADQASLDRFHREARIIAALDHPNIVRAYDIDQEGDLHYLVMEYVDGSNLQEIVRKHGPMDILRACHYIRQAAVGLQHAHQFAGLVHRDIKPSNLLVDRHGIVKVLDMGLARFFHDEDDVLTKKYDEAVLGTADYLAPEQALDSHAADIRADIYSLGATFYFLLTGCAPFKEGSVAQKLLWHQTKVPKPIRSYRPEVPESLTAIVERMMVKDPGRRYQTPIEVAEALAPWTVQPIPPPPAAEMPQLCPAAQTTAVLANGAASGPISPYPGTAVCTELLVSPGSSTPTPKSLPRPTPPLQTAPAPDSMPPRLAAASPFAFDRSSASPDRTDLAWQNLPPVRVHRTRVPAAPRFQFNRRTAWLVGLGVGGALLFLVLLIWLWPHGAISRTGTTQPLNQTLIVRQDGQEGAYRSLQDALDNAQPGDHIVVRDPQIEGCLRVDGSFHGRGVTIESGLPDQHVLWTCPSAPPDGVFVSLTRAVNLHVKGFVLDGRQRVADLVTISGSCPGLVLEDIQLRGFQRSGLSLHEARGKVGDGTLQLLRLKVRGTPGKLPEAALRFSGDLCEHIQVQGGQFEGPLAAGIEVAGGIQNVAVRDSHLAKSNTGLLYGLSVPRHPINLRLTGNTFSDMQTALHFQGRPLAEATNAIVLQQNVFAHVNQLLKMETDPPDPHIMAKLFAGSGGNKRDPSTKPEVLVPTDVAATPVPPS